jgi:hypothetical protein
MWVAIRHPYVEKYPYMCIRMHTEGATYRIGRIRVKNNLHIPATPDAPAPSEHMNDPAYNFGKKELACRYQPLDIFGAF